MSKDGKARGSGFSAGLISGFALCAVAATTATVLVPLENGDAMPAVQTGASAPAETPAAPAKDAPASMPQDNIQEAKAPNGPANGDDTPAETAENEPISQDTGVEAASAAPADDPAPVSDDNTPVAEVPQDVPDLPAVADVTPPEPLQSDEPPALDSASLPTPESPAVPEAPELAQTREISPDAPELPRQPSGLEPKPAPEVDAGVDVAALPSAPRIESPATAPVAAANPPDAAPQAPTSNVALPAIVAGSTPEQPDAGPAPEDVAIVRPEAEVATPNETASAESLTVSDSVETDAVAETESGPPPSPILTGPAFDVLAAEFESDGRPMLAIVLEFVGEEGLARDDLLDLQAAYTFALSPEAEDGLWSDHKFRDAGFEVVALVPKSGDARLGQDTNEADVSGLIDGYLAAVPGAVAVMDAPGGDVFRNARVVAALSEALAATGRGVFLHERFGVNSALQAVRGANVPAASVLRVIDENRSADAIRRNLDRAALDAKKSGAVVVLGHTYPETMSTLLTWQLGRTAEGVQIAPVTAVVRRLTQ